MPFKSGAINWQSLISCYDKFMFRNSLYSAGCPVRDNATTAKITVQEAQLEFLCLI
jgi:hypothetical protein